ncbi:7TM diverse intracellular signaling domain-containing protein [Turneriella parva]|uniref:Adenylate/guanylate cyclase n=1 Tax=Turneriella parva (strain ATCC BAA-1111 / DSM 21527 / NCTC 11395 / H) TaxID=869212 RepID=I4B5A1_TURPD|nr:7TM diverse intracellular signaling domain-containing protein [Turneriella parva]AFM12458.1 adenylate/guanylate cyclase [Turneriella parva DSM 21527]
MKKFNLVKMLMIGLLAGKTAAAATSPIDWGTGTKQLNLGSSMDFYKDETGEASLATVRKLPDSAFASADKANLGFFVKPVWLRFRFTPTAERLMLRHDYAMTDYVTLYEPGKNGYDENTQGDMIDFARRDVKHRLVSFWITPRSTDWYYIRLQTKGSVNLAFTLADATQALESDHVSQYFLGMFFGTIAVMFFYNFFLFFSLREPAYLFYCCYIGSFAILAGTLNGISYQLLWPASPWLQNRAFSIFAGSAMSFGIIFAMLFLNLKQLSRPLYLAAHAVGAAGTGVALSAFVLDPGTSVRIANVLGIPWVLALLSSAVLAWWRDYKPARYFLAAWIVMLAGTVVFTLTTRGVLPPNPFFVNAMLVGSALEVILLSLALADRINVLKKDKERIQQQALDKQKRLTDAYSRFFPRRMLELLDRDSVEQVTLGDATERDMTVLFADIRGFTTLSEKMTPRDSFKFLNSYLKRMSPIIRAHDGFIDKFMGDGIMALFPENSESALKAAITMQQTVRKYNHHRMKSGYDPIRIGIGIHKGALMLGTVGEQERMDGTVISDAVNLASRIESLTKKFDADVLISESVFHDLADPTVYMTRVIARVKVKGKEQPVTVLQVFDGMPDYQIEMLDKTRGAFERGFLSFHERRFADAQAMFRQVIEINPGDSVADMYLEKARYFELIGSTKPLAGAP